MLRLWHVFARDFSALCEVFCDFLCKFVVVETAAKIPFSSVSTPPAAPKETKLEKTIREQVVVGVCFVVYFALRLFLESVAATAVKDEQRFKGIYIAHYHNHHHFL